MTCPPETLVHLSAPRGELNLTGPHTVSHIIGNSFRLLGKKKYPNLEARQKHFLHVLSESCSPPAVGLANCGVGRMACSPLLEKGFYWNTAMATHSCTVCGCF